MILKMSRQKHPSIETLSKRIKQRTVTFPDGTSLPCLGQGTWRMGENPRQRDEEVRALQFGIELGMQVIDTAEMYADGGAERIVGEAIKGRRDKVFIVSKVYPHHAGLDHIFQACENSLQRLGTDYLDLYLLHWRGSVPLAETVEGMEKLRQDGKILRWGVSNFDIDDLRELWNTPNGARCMTNQVLYHLGSRGIEFDLLPWQREKGLPVMAYCPLAQGGSLRRQLLTDPVIGELARRYDVEPLQIALAWVIRTNDVMAIPKAGREEHVLANAQAAAIQLSDDDLHKLERVFPKPTRKMPLDIV